MPKPSSYVLFYRRRAVGAGFDYYATYNYSTFTSNMATWGLDDYKVKFARADGTPKTLAELSVEIAHFKSEIMTKYGIPAANIQLKLSESGFQFRFVTTLQCAPNFFHIPGGGSKGSESPLATAAREVEEELGFPRAELAAILADATKTSVKTKGDRTVYRVDISKITGASFYSRFVRVTPTTYTRKSFGTDGDLSFVSSTSEVIFADWVSQATFDANLAKFSFALS